jgi:hypothetical protein
MELSALSVYPVSDPFIRDDGEELPLCWDANFFTRARLRQFDEDLNKAVDAARKPHADRLNALQAEVSALATAQEKREGKEPIAEDGARLEAIVGEVNEAAEALEDAVIAATKEVYAEAFAGNGDPIKTKLLLSWGMTHQGESVPIAKEVLTAQPLLFLQDLMGHARQRSLPKSRRAATARRATTSQPI